MKRKMRKVISLVLALSMCLSLMQMTAFATDDTSAAGEAGYTQETPSAETTQETPAAETTEETPAAEATEETPAAETTEETPAAETTEETSPAETAKETPAAGDAKDETAQDSKDETKDETAKDTKDETETEKAESVEITGSESAKGVTVNVDAPAGAFPGGTTLSITPITLFNNFLGIPMNNIKGSIADTMDEDTELEGAVAFDITFMYDGAEVQPADGYTIDVQFVVDDANKAIGTEANELQVYHLEDASGEAAPVGEPAPFDAEAGNNTVSVDAKSFSIYVVSGVNSTTKITGDSVVTVGSSITIYNKDEDTYNLWSVSDTSIATIAPVSGNDIYATLTGVKAGKVTVTHQYYSRSWRTYATLDVTVVASNPVSITDNIKTTGNLTASYSGTSTGTITYTWQRSHDGTTWTDDAATKVTTINGTDYYNINGANLNAALDYTAARTAGVVSDNNQRFYYKVTAHYTDASGKHTATSAAFQVPYYMALQNGSFETPVVKTGDKGNQRFIDDAKTNPSVMWKTTASDNKIELLSSATNEYYTGSSQDYGKNYQTLTNKYHHVDGADRGVQFVELNANNAGALYQDVMTVPGTKLNWTVSHRGRDSATVTDDMYVVIMSAGDAETHATTQDGLMDTVSSIDSYTGAYAQMFSATNAAWISHSGTYIVPAGQYVTRFFFAAGDTAHDKLNYGDAESNTVGNHIDNVWFSTDMPEPNPDLGNLSITKTVSGLESGDNAPAGAFTFIVKNSEGNEVGTISLPTVTGGLTGGLSDLAPGDYTVTETDPAETLTANGNSYAYNNTTYAVGTAAAAAGKTATVNVAASGTGSVTFANSYDAVSTNVGFYFDKVWTNTVGTAMTVTLTDGTTDYTFTVNGNASGTFGSSDQYAWTKTVDTANAHIWNIAVSGLPGSTYSIKSETAAGYTSVIAQGTAVIAGAKVINPCSELTISNIDSSFIAVKQTGGLPYIIWTMNALSKTQQDMLAAKVCSYGSGFNNDGKGYVYYYGTGNAAVAKIANATDGKTVTFGAHSAWAKILYGTYTATAPTITNTPSTGSLTVTKTISGLTAARTGDYTLNVTITNKETNAAESHTITIGTAQTQGSWTFTDLAPGTYTVTESNVQGVPSFYEDAASGNTTTANATVVSNQTASASLTNNYQRTAPTVVLGSITVTKTIEGITGPYSVDVTVGGVTRTISIAAGETTGTATFTDLDAGTYNVTETFPTVSGYHEAAGSVESGTVNLSLGALDYTTNTKTVSSGTAALDNKYAHDTGIVTVAKTSTIDGVSDTAGTYTFGLYTKSGSDYTQVGDTISVAGGATETFAAVDTGATYYVKELNADKTDYSLSTAYKLDGAAAEANADGYVEIANLNAAVTVGCANTYTLNTVNVSGTKTWDNVDAYMTATGAAAGPANSALTITLYADGIAENKVPTWNGNTYTFSGLRAANNGTAIKYTVAETAMSGFDKQTIDGSTCFVAYQQGTSGLVYGFWKSAQSGNDFTNAWVNAGEEGTGTFTVVKNGVKDRTTSPLKGVTFTLYNYSATATDHIGTQVAVRTTTDSAEEYTNAVFSGLTEGSYILVETSRPAGYTGAGPWTVTVSSNGKTYVETQAPSADNGNVFTNIYNWAVSILTGTDPDTGWNASASTLTVANNYAVTDVTPTSLTLTGTKTLSGKTLTANAFNFAVTENGTTVATGTNDANGLVTFSAINYTTSAAAGEHTYTVSETSTSGSGITVDDSTYTVVANVTYTDNGDGTATMAVTSVTENRQTLAYPYNVGTFRNTYAVTDVTPTSLTLTATKTLSGKALTANAFNFAVTENGMTVATGTNDANGLVTFSAINYNAQTAVGTHTYTVSETSTNGNGITVDNAIFTVDATVTYTDNGDGTAAMAVTSVTENDQTLASPYNVGTFRNTYAVTDVTPTSLTLTGTKTLSGKALTANAFNFAVTENGTTVATGTNDADGLITFSAINYNAQTAAGTHTYTVSETSTNGNGITVDNAIFTVDATVTYTDNGDGTAAMAVTSVTENDQTLASPYNVGTFRNTYAVTDVTPTSLTLTGTKTLSGKTLTANAFNFAVTENGTTVATGTNDANGLVTFSAINYTTSAAAGEHTYTVSETSTSGSGITVDDSTYTVVANVTYTDNGDGTATMAVTSVTENRQTLAYPYNVGTFRNTYAVTDVTPASLTLTATKTLSGKALTAKAFNFAVTENGMTVATGTNDADGLVKFSEINYNAQTAAGTHTYTVSETSTNGSGITVDNGTYNVVANVTYTDNGDGTATMAVISVTENDQTLASPYNVGTFRNTYTAQPVSLALTGTKMLSGKALTAGMFSFNLYETGSTFATAGLTPVTVRNDARGNIDFGTKTFSTAGTYYFVAQEIAGSNGGVTYDTTARDITVVVSDNGLGNLVITFVNGAAVTNNTYSVGTFTNTYAVPDTASAYLTLTGTKALTGRSMKAMTAGEFTFKVMEGEKQVSTGSVTADGSITFTAISYNNAGIGEHTYTVTEDAGTVGGVAYDSTVYTVTVTVSDDGNGGIAVGTPAYAAGTEAKTGIAFTNTYSAAPASFTIGGTKTYNQTLTDNMFSFRLYGAEITAVPEVQADTASPIVLAVTDAAPETVNNTGAAFTFAAKSYTAAGDYWYIVDELNGGQTINGITYDGHVYAVKVSVTDNGSGALAAAKTVYALTPSDNGYTVGDAVTSDTVAFTNSYASVIDTAGTSINLTGKKVLTGTSMSDKEFSFQVTENGTVVAQGTNDANGNITFSAISYAAPGTHTYAVTELNGGIAYVSYDTTSYTVTVTVTGTDNGLGTTTLSAAAVYPEGGVVFHNAFEYDGGDDPKPPVVIPDPDVPHGDNPDTPSIPDTPTEIPDEPTPHAEAPKTGDNNSLWLFIALASGIGIVALNLGGRKRKEDDKQ